ncbi:hypothetical protein ACQP2Y_21545 [Actinoplanes sp. CA-051413]|uniref:hypothetical protein n=1 Tax=Actinoplanes sp. CA-051413 TaxID=3239899 RepID=UPI003D98F4F8
MSGYADPELAVAEWLRDTLNVKVWADPKPPSDRWANAPWLWVQRGQTPNGLALTLDDVLLDCDAYSAEADHARELGQRVRDAMVLQLPLTTFTDGLFVKQVTTESAPAWAPDPKFRRAAAYRLVMHGLVGS